MKQHYYESFGGTEIGVPDVCCWINQTYKSLFEISLSNNATLSESGLIWMFFISYNMSVRCFCCLKTKKPRFWLHFSMLQNFLKRIWLQILILIWIIKVWIIEVRLYCLLQSQLLYIPLFCWVGIVWFRKISIPHHRQKFHLGPWIFHINFVRNWVSMSPKQSL